MSKHRKVQMIVSIGTVIVALLSVAAPHLNEVIVMIASIVNFCWVWGE